MALLVVPGGATGQQADERCELVALDSAAIHACVSGTSGPGVVLASGAGLSLRTWDPVVAALPSSVRVIRFDRPGLGSSPPSTEVRSARQVARELRALLEELEFGAPLILMGHSMGGLHVLRLAELLPETVARVILLDTPPPGFEESRRTLLSAEERAERDRLLAEGAASAPDVVRREREATQPEREWIFTDLPPGLPITVLVADSQYFGEQGSPEEHRELWLSESRRWLALTDRTSLVVAEGSGHMIHRDRTDLVVRLLRELSQRH